jgi:hypothetical protein
VGFSWLHAWHKHRAINAIIAANTGITDHFISAQIRFLQLSKRCRNEIAGPPNAFYSEICNDQHEHAMNKRFRLRRAPG